MILALYARDTPSCWARQHHRLSASAVRFFDSGQMLVPSNAMTQLK